MSVPGGPLQVGSARIRVITPESAMDNSHLSYNDGQPVPLSLTLRQLKIGIAGLLKMRNLSLPRRGNSEPTTVNKCNCDFAQTISNHGIWDTLRCRLHRTDRPSCVYPHEALPRGDCGICSLPLTQHCNECETPSLYNPACPLVINTGCNHCFHHHCYMNKPGESCPQGCSLRSSCALCNLIFRVHAKGAETSFTDAKFDHRCLRTVPA